MRWTSAALAAGLATLACAPPPSAAPRVGSAVVQKLAAQERARVIVVLREPAGPVASAAARQDVVAGVQQRVLSRLRAADFRLTRRFGNFPVLAGELSSAGLARLAADPEVARVDLEGRRYKSTAESVPLIRGSEARSAGFTGRGVTVAVIDTGVDSTHPDLSDSIAAEVCFCEGCCPGGGATASGAGAANDDDGHGTNVAGIINSAGRVAPVGVAPDSAIVAIRVLSSDGGFDSDILAGLDYVLDHPAIRVVNMSLGGGKYSSICDDADAPNQAYGQALARLRAQGTLTVVAAGNEGFTDAVSSPACINAALAVGAVYDGNNGGLDWGDCIDSSTDADVVTCFSNSSPLVELLAPGALITSSGPGGRTLTEGGTSQATPHVAGAAAVLLQANPRLTPSQIIDTLSRTGRPVTDRKSGLSIPRIDVMAAVQAVR